MAEMEELPVFSEGPPPEVIYQQPSHSRYPGNRRQVSVSTIDDHNSQYAFISGLEFMRDTNQFVIQQTVELSDLMSSVASESRHTVKVPRGDTIYYATENSPGCERTCFGSGRSFRVSLYDRTQQEVMSFNRRLACGYCTFWCYLQKMEVWLPPGELVGTISQNIQPLKSSFNVCNRHNEVIFKIEGPNSFGCLLGKGHNFQIYNSDGTAQIGSIIYQWDQTQVAYNLMLQMPPNVPDLRYKALLMGASFLLEYMYFQSNRNNKLACCC